MSIGDRYDVVIAGGGLAGLCLAIQLRRARPATRVLIAERSPHPAPEAAHKVGESSVEVGSHYLGEVLGLSDALEQELRKFGLRFFMSHDGNRDIATRLECGPSHFLTVPSYQIDRGRFESALARRAVLDGVDFADECKVVGIELGPEEEDHVLRLERDSTNRDVSCRWVVDATGRRSLLKKKLALTKDNRHVVNAAWFRFDHPIDLDDWSEDLSWRSRNKHPRRLSTNHLMGEGYWVWFIPLAGDRTSVGIVVDDRLHPFTDLNTFEAASRWLARHEPQCADIIDRLADCRMDFLALRNYSHDAKKVFSADRWCIVGDAGFFIDPLYSPGTDFIAIANGFSCDLVGRDLDGCDVAEMAGVYDDLFRTLARTFMFSYHRQYPLMGCGRAMATKVIWDFVMYWGGIAQLFFRNKFTDAAFMERVRPTLQGFAQTNVSVQGSLRAWAEAGREADAETGFVDYAEIPFLARLNRELLDGCGDDALLVRLERNLELARELRMEILAATGRTGPAGSSHLDRVFSSR